MTENRDTILTRFSLAEFGAIHVTVSRLLYGANSIFQNFQIHEEI